MLRQSHSRAQRALRRRARPASPLTEAHSCDLEFQMSGRIMQHLKTARWGPVKHFALTCTPTPLSYSQPSVSYDAYLRRSALKGSTTGSAGIAMVPQIARRRCTPKVVNPLASPGRNGRVKWLWRGSQIVGLQMHWGLKTRSSRVACNCSWVGRPVSAHAAGAASLLAAVTDRGAAVSQAQQCWWVTACIHSGHNQLKTRAQWSVPRVGWPAHPGQATWLALRRRVSTASRCASP